MKTRAMVLEAFHAPLRMRELEIPALEASEVLVRIDAAGVCGSDVHMWKGEDERTPLPIVLGHEGVGTVVDVKGRKEYVTGEAVKIEDPILWNRGVSCGGCYYCAVLNQPWLCGTRKVYGINRPLSEAPGPNGCYAEHLVLAASTDIFKIDGDIDPAILVSASCSGATVAHAFDEHRFSYGSTVLVQGPGPLGVFAVAFARHLGAGQIMVTGALRAVWSSARHSAQPLSLTGARRASKSGRVLSSAGPGAGASMWWSRPRGTHPRCVRVFPCCGPAGRTCRSVFPSRPAVAPSISFGRSSERT